MPIDYTLLMKRKASKVCAKPWGKLKLSELMRIAPTAEERAQLEEHLQARAFKKSGRKLRLISSLTNLTCQ